MNLSRKQLPTYEFSPEGFEKVKKELEKLIEDRVVTVEHLSEARNMGDLSENGYYKEARAKLSSIDSRIRRLKIMMKYAKVIEKKKSDRVSFGSVVKVLVKGVNPTMHLNTFELRGAQKEFKIVGKEESDPSNGRLSTISPIGKALMGKKKGDKFVVKIPVGEMEYEIENVE